MAFTSSALSSSSALPIVSAQHHLRGNDGDGDLNDPLEVRKLAGEGDSKRSGPVLSELEPLEMRSAVEQVSGGGGDNKFAGLEQLPDVEAAKARVEQARCCQAMDAKGRAEVLRDLLNHKTLPGGEQLEEQAGMRLLQIAGVIEAMTSTDEYLASIEAALTVCTLPKGDLRDAALELRKRCLDECIFAMRGRPADLSALRDRLLEPRARKAAHESGGKAALELRRFANDKMVGRVGVPDGKASGEAALDPRHSRAGAQSARAQPSRDWIDNILERLPRVGPELQVDLERLPARVTELKLNPQQLESAEQRLVSGERLPDGRAALQAREIVLATVYQLRGLRALPMLQNAILGAALLDAPDRVVAALYRTLTDDQRATLVDQACDPRSLPAAYSDKQGYEAAVKMRSWIVALATGDRKKALQDLTLQPAKDSPQERAKHALRCMLLFESMTREERLVSLNHLLGLDGAPTDQRDGSRHQGCAMECAAVMTRRGEDPRAALWRTLPAESSPAQQQRATNVRFACFVELYRRESPAFIRKELARIETAKSPPSRAALAYEALRAMAELFARADPQRRALMFGLVAQDAIAQKDADARKGLTSLEAMVEARNVAAKLVGLLAGDAKGVPPKS